MPPKGKPDTAGYEKFLKDLESGIFGQLYLFHGEETYLRDHYLGQLKDKLLAGGRCPPAAWRRRWTACP